MNPGNDAAIWAVTAAAVAAAVSVTGCEALMGVAIVLLIATRTSWRLPPVWLPLALFMAGTMASLLACGHIREGVPQIKKFFVYLMLILVFTAFRGLGRLFWLAAGWGGALALSAALGVWQFAEKYRAAAALHTPFYSFYIDDRITGFSSHWMTFSGQLMIGILVAGACVLLGGFRRTVRWLFTAAILLMCVALAGAWTRSVWLGTLCGGVYLIWFWRRWALAAFPALIAILLLSNPFGLRQRMVSAYSPHGDTDSNAHRAELREIGWRMIAAHPLLGVGPEQVSRQMANYLPPGMAGLTPGQYYGHLENDYMQYAAERGVPAMLALMWTIAWALFDFHRVLRRLPADAQERWILHGAVAVTIAMLVSGFYSWNLNTSVVLAMFLAVMGCGYVAAAPHKSDA